jgi:hypothetical protein
MKSYERANELSKVFNEVQAWMNGDRTEPFHLTSSHPWSTFYQKALESFEDQINAAAFEMLRGALKQAKSEAELDLMSASIIVGAIKCE